MKPRSPRLLIYVMACAAVVLAAAVTYEPLVRAWTCYQRYANAPTANAEFVEAAERSSVVRLVDGPRVGETCTLPVALEDVTDGERFAVAYLSETPERCELVGTVEYAGVVLVSVTLGFGCLGFLLVVGAIAADRGLARPAVPERAMEIGPEGAVCPSCNAKMTEGAAVPTGPVHWRTPAQPIGLTPLFQGLPGTFSWRRRPVLHAFRCERCEVLALQYGV